MMTALLSLEVTADFRPIALTRIAIATARTVNRFDI